LARHSQKVTVRLTGWGLVAYALILAAQIVFQEFVPVLLLCPALLWIGAAIHLLPEEYQNRSVLIRSWAIASVPLVILVLVNPWFSLLIILFLMICAGMIAKLARRSQFKNTFAVLAVLALFVTLSAGLLILPFHWIPLSWGMALLGCDLIFLGITITTWDAFEEGESIHAHLVRSFVSALYYSGALVILAGIFSNDSLLLVLLMSFGILTQTFSNDIQALLDRLTLPQQTMVERQTLRETAEALPLLSTPTILENEEEFLRLTRRALSHLGDLPKLTTSPLVNLPAIQGTNPLDRAHSLKSLLVKSIQKLKPQSDISFGTTDEWRYYNSLYFPYVLGIKPYTRRAEYFDLDESSRAAFDWFQTAVPERTLHNWQNAAAKLVAADLKVAMKSEPQGIRSKTESKLFDSTANWQ
jgi:hypothetical protein